jgi:ribosomal protein S6
MNEINDSVEVNDKSVYEVGYHLMPTVDEAETSALVSNIKNLIEGAGGSFISDDMPKMMPLAYDISKNINSKNNIFSKAYFGWIKFELPSLKIEEIKKGLEKNVQILRFILLKTVRENTMYQPKFSRPRKDGKEMTPDGTGEVKEVSVEEIDKSIEDLVIN